MGIMTSKRRRTAGFTMSEMLIVIALITLMAAMSVPGLMSLKRDIEITRLDETAKEIYNAAQNSLTRANLGGELAPLVSANRITNKPVDFDAGLTWSSDGYHYAADGSAAAKLLLPLGSIDDSVRLGGNYIIEYDLKSGTIYAVFYSEKKELDYTYLNSLQFRGGRQTRRRSDIGYYGGGGIERDSFTDCATPLLTVINGNDLKILIAGQKEDYTVSAQLEDEQGNSVDLDSLGSELLLDSLTGERFNSNTKYAGLTPGDDITVTVTFEKAGKFLSSSASAKVNSLFAAKDDETDYKAEIGCARHLQNLDAEWSGLDVGSITATQTANIDLTGIAFRSITNSSLSAYDGATQKIIGLTGKNGVFASLNAASLKDVYIVDPVIADGGTAGALAGSLTNCTVSGCRVYAYDGNCYISGSNAVGGLIGSTSGGSVSGSFAAAETLSSPTAGGLIGSCNGTYVSDSYASCGSLSGSGMLIGGGVPASVTSCYAVGTSTSNNFSPDSSADAALLAKGNCYYVYSYMADGVSQADKGGESKQGAKPPYTHPYTVTGDYPYRAVGGLPHYGDWPEVADSATMYFYLDDKTLVGIIQCVPGKTMNHQSNDVFNQYKGMDEQAEAILGTGFNIKGWVYVVNGEEFPYDFNKVVITSDMILYPDFGITGNGNN